MMDSTKREFREEKRLLKRAGSRHRRRDLKQALRENPDEAHEAQENFGRFSTARLNGLDRDVTRKGVVASESPAEEAG